MLTKILSKAAMSTTETLPDLSSVYDIAADAVSAYRRDGHIILRAVASPDEIAAYRSVIVNAAYRHNTQDKPLVERDTYGKAFLQIMNLWTVDDAVKRFTLAQRFGKIAADLMGVDAVRVYHDQALFKEPGGGPTPWHQDQHYWPLETNNTITLWMPLVDIPEDIGSMSFGSGSHSLGNIGDMAISDTSDAELKRFIGEQGLKVSGYGAMMAGDATFHAGWTLHGAKGNPTPKTREVMTVIYYEDGSRITPPINKDQENDMAENFPGLRPGNIAATDMNPIVYSRR